MDPSPKAKEGDVPDLTLPVVSLTEKSSKQEQDEGSSNRRTGDSWAIRPPRPPKYIRRPPGESSSGPPATSRRTLQLFDPDDSSRAFRHHTSSPRTLDDQLRDCENERRYLRDKVSALEGNADRMELRLEQRRNETAMSATALKKCIKVKEDDEKAKRDYIDRIAKCHTEKSVMEAEKRRLESELADSVGKGADCLRKLERLNAELESLRSDNESLQRNLQKAEMEKKMLSEENMSKLPLKKRIFES